ncbi:hypothetical protein D1007_25367 [Hordeum vulgare]|nr:hypothetical protein D1007_25367 [Hordeum vulgare]
MYNWGKYVREDVLLSAGRVKFEILGGKVKSNISGCTFFIRPRPAHTVCYSINRCSTASFFRITNYGAESRKVEKGPMIEEIASILVEKVGQYSARCKTLLQLASKKGAKINKHHSDGWDGIIRETENFIEEMTYKILTDIDEISEAIRQSKKGIGNKTNKMGGSPKRARVEDTEDEHDDATKNLDELIAAADQANKDNIDTEVHEKMPIQGRSANGRRWIYGPDSALNTEVPSYDLGIENDEQVQPEARELSIFAATQQAHKI